MTKQVPEQGMSERRRFRPAPSVFFFVCVVAVSGACSFQDFDYLKHRPRMSDTSGAGGEGGGGTTSDLGGTTSDAGDSAGEANSAGTASGGAAGGGGSAEAAGATAAGAAGAAGAATRVSPLLGPFEFDTAASVVQWLAGGDSGMGATVRWIAQGEAEPLGALVCTSPAAATFTYVVPASMADQSNRRLHIRVRAESGTTAAKIFAFSTGYVWSDGGEQAVTTSWSTVSMNLQAPQYESPTYDSKQIIAVGIEMPKPGVLWVDRLWMDNGTSGT